MTSEPKNAGTFDADGEAGERLGPAVADLVGNVVDNALRLTEDVTRDASRVVTAARDFMRSLLDG